jgi:Tfp pilus assembly protein PilX
MLSYDNLHNCPCLRKQKGFALVTAILAIMILLALGILALSVSTQDIKISAQTVGEKKAASAAEAGIHQLIRGFNPENLTSSQATNVVVDSSSDPDSKYSISSPTRPTSGPEMLPLAGYSIGGGQSWGERTYRASVTGTNTRYSSSMQIDVGVGYGPIEISTMSR